MQAKAPPPAAARRRWLLPTGALSRPATVVARSTTSKHRPAVTRRFRALGEQGGGQAALRLLDAPPSMTKLAEPPSMMKLAEPPSSKKSTSSRSRCPASAASASSSAFVAAATAAVAAMSDIVAAAAAPTACPDPRDGMGSGDDPERPKLTAVAALDGIRAADEEEGSDGGGGRRRCVLTIDTCAHEDLETQGGAQEGQGAHHPTAPRVPKLWLQFMSEDYAGDSSEDGLGGGARWRSETEWLGEVGRSAGVWEILDNLRWG